MLINCDINYKVFIYQAGHCVEMITCPDHWSDRPSANGLILLPRQEEVPGCIIRYTERMVPQRSLWALVKEVLAFDAEFKVAAVEPVDCFLSDEGEHAAAVYVSGTAGGRPMAHMVGAIFAEDFSTLVDGRIRDTTRAESYRSVIRTLIQQDRLSLGMRRRRLLFIPPADWHAVAFGLGTALYPPEYPRLLSCIVVSPAEPRSNGDFDIVAQRQREDARRGLQVIVGPDAAPTTHTTANGLLCTRYRSTYKAPDQTVVVRDLAVLRDDYYLYTLQLDATQHGRIDAHRKQFLDLVESVRPVPRSTATLRPLPWMVTPGAGPQESPLVAWDD